MKTLLMLLVLAIAIPARAQQLDDAAAPQPATQPAPQPNLQLAAPEPIVAPAPQPFVDAPRNFKLVRNRGLIVGGGVSFGVSWLMSVVGMKGGGPYMAIPIGGPILLATYTGRYSDPQSSALTTLLILDSVTQVAGLAMVIVGATTHHRVLNPRVTVVPVATRDQAGAAVRFRF